MSGSTEIFLPDTTVSFEKLKKKLNEVYDLELITKKEKYIYIGVVVLLGGFLIYKIS